MTMQRFLATAFTMLAVVASLAIPAQPAAADPAGTNYYTDAYADWLNEACVTPYQTGVLGAYGAWGFYIDGCTTRTASCPTFVPPRYVSWCKVTSRGQISTRTTAGHRVTLNSRVRLYDSDSTIVAWLDKSCEGLNACTQPAAIVTWLLPGQKASNQCNGVRQYATNTAHVECDLRIQYMY
jgi:hypothetical protein